MPAGARIVEMAVRIDNRPQNMDYISQEVRNDIIYGVSGRVHSVLNTNLAVEGAMMGWDMLRAKEADDE